MQFIGLFNLYIHVFLSFVDLCVHLFAQLSLASVGNVIQTIQVYQLSIAKLWRLRSIGYEVVSLFLHFLELGHLNEYFMDLIL